MNLFKIILTALLLTTFNIRADDNIKNIDIDLAKIDEDITNDLKIEVKDAGLFQIKLINTLPSMKYSVRIGDIIERLGPLKLVINTDAKGCNEIWEAEKFNLFYEIDERIIRVIRKTFKENLEQYCETENLKKTYPDSLNSLTERFAFATGIEFKEGEIKDIRIVREASKEDDKEHIWNVAVNANGDCEEKIKEVIVEKPVYYNNGEKASYEMNDNWGFSYGFAFPIMFSNDEYYFVKQSDSIPEMYEIKKRRDNQYIRFIPSLFLHWNPDLAEGIEWSYSVTGGVGFDMENPIVFAGGSVIYHSKLNFNFGLVVHKVSKLNGKYSTGDLVNDILDFWQLHEEHYRMNPFIGVSFKF